MLDIVNDSCGVTDGLLLCELEIDCELVLLVEYVLSLVCVGLIVGLFVKEIEVLPEFEADDDGDSDPVFLVE